MSSVIKAYPKKERSVDDASDPKYITGTEPANDAEKHALDINIASATADIPIDPGPLQFLLDGASQEVTEDTVDPANNRPLPVKLTGFAGDITVNANELNISTTHTNDSMRLGDGTNLTSVTATGQLEVKAGELETGLAALEASLTSIETKIDASNVLLTSINGKDYATQTTLSSLETKAATETSLTSAISELQDIEADVEAVDAKLTQTNLKLDTLNSNGAKEAKQDSIISELNAQEVLLTSISNEDFATETSLSALNAKVTAIDTTGKATEAKQDSIITELTQIEADIETGNGIKINAYTEQLSQGLSLDSLNTEQLDQGLSLDAISANQATAAKQDLALTELQAIKTNNLAGNLLQGVEADTVEQAQTATTDIFTYKLATVTQATITITYTDSSKDILLSAVKS